MSDMSDLSDLSDFGDLGDNDGPVHVPNKKLARIPRDPGALTGVHVYGRLPGKNKREDASEGETHRPTKKGRPPNAPKKWARIPRDPEALPGVYVSGRLPGKNKRDDDSEDETQRPTKKARPHKLPKKHRTASEVAGLIFPVTRTRRGLRAGGYSKRVGVGAGVYLAAVLEYLATEVLECTGNFTLDAKKKRITPRHIYLALRNDIELNQFTKHVTIPQSGVIPQKFT